MATTPRREAPEELRQLILHGREERNLEYKASMEWLNARQKVLRAALSFANTRDGGTIILGIEERDTGSFEAVGMKEAHFDTFNQDDVQAYVNEYADPYVRLNVESIELDSKVFVAVEVEPFELYPVVCKKTGEKVGAGQIFSRSYKKHESAPVAGQAEMREIIDMAVEKGIRDFHERINRAGLKATPAGELDALEFDKELAGL